MRIIALSELAVNGYEMSFDLPVLDMLSFQVVRQLRIKCLLVIALFQTKCQDNVSLDIAPIDYCLWSPKECNWRAKLSSSVELHIVTGQDATYIVPTKLKDDPAR